MTVQFNVQLSLFITSKHPVMTPPTPLFVGCYMYSCVFIMLLRFQMALVRGYGSDTAELVKSVFFLPPPALVAEGILIEPPFLQTLLSTLWSLAPDDLERAFHLPRPTSDIWYRYNALPCFSL